MKDFERMAQFFDCAIHDFQVECFKVCIVQPEHAGE